MAGGPVARGYIDVVAQLDEAKFNDEVKSGATRAANTFAADGTDRIKASINSLVPTADVAFSRISAKAEETGAVMAAGLSRGVKDSENALRGLLGFGAIAGVGFIVGEQIKKALETAQTAGSLAAGTDQLIKNLGTTAQVTAVQVEGLTDKLSLAAGINPEVQRAVENTLIPVNLSAAVFNRASQAADDLGAKTHNTATAAIALSKALQAPNTAAQALRRVQVILTDAQKQSITTFLAQGQQAKAQGVILDAVEKKFGGLASATKTAGGVLGNFATQIEVAFGGGLSKGIDGLAASATSTLPQLKALASSLGGDIGIGVQTTLPLLEHIIQLFDELVKGISPVVGLVSHLTPLLDVLAARVLVSLLGKIGLNSVALGRLGTSFAVAGASAQFAAGKFALAEGAMAKTAVAGEAAAGGILAGARGLTALAGGPIGIGLTVLTLFPGVLNKVTGAFSGTSAAVKKARADIGALASTLTQDFKTTDLTSVQKGVDQIASIVNTGLSKALGDKSSNSIAEKLAADLNAAGGQLTPLVERDAAALDKLVNYGLVPADQKTKDLLATIQAGNTTTNGLNTVAANATSLAKAMGITQTQALVLAKSLNLDLSGGLTTYDRAQIQAQVDTLNTTRAMELQKQQTLELTKGLQGIGAGLTNQNALRTTFEDLNATLVKSGADSRDFRSKAVSALNDVISKATAGNASLDTIRERLHASAAAANEFGGAGGHAVAEFISALSQLPPEVASQLGNLGGIGTAAGKALADSLIAQLQIADAAIKFTLQYAASGLSVAGGSILEVKSRNAEKNIAILKQLEAQTKSFSGGTLPPVTGGSGSGSGGGATTVQKADLVKLGQDLGKALLGGIASTRPVEGAIHASVKAAVDQAQQAIAGLAKTDKASLIAPLTSFVNSHAKALENLAGGYDTVTSKIAKTKTAIDSLTQSNQQFADSVTQSLTQTSSLNTFLQQLQQTTTSISASAPSLAGPTTTTVTATATSAGLQAFLTSSLSSLQQFSTGLATLTAENLNKNLLSQLATGGVSSQPVVSALLGASPTQLATINSLQSQIDSLSKQTGQAAAFTQFGVQLSDLNKTQKEQLAEQKRTTAALETQVNKLIRSIDNIITGQTQILSRSSTSTKHIVGSSTR